MNPFIQQYCQLSAEGSEQVLFEWEAVTLLQPEKLSAILIHLKTEYQATGLDLPASLLGTALFGPIIALIIQNAEDGQSADVSLANISIQLALYNGISPYLTLKLNETGQIQSGQLSDLLPDFIHQNLTLPINSIAKAAHVKPALIWNQFGARLASTIEAYTKYQANEHVLMNFKRYTDLIESLPGHVFELRKNPFVHKPTYIDSPYEPGTPMMIRSACCMFYKREGGEKCANCPLLHKE